jgi:hypothetical protein
VSDYFPTESEQMPLFESMHFPPVESEQTKQLKRVTGKLADAIQLFFDGMQPGEEFHGPALTEFVEKQIAATVPDSASRVMRNMRQSGQINYEVANRGQSLYRVLACQSK